MAHEPSPAFQFYPRDYLSDAKVRAMSYKERGMYWELCSLLWLERALPVHPPTLSRILGVTLAEFRKAWPALEPCFRMVDDKSLEHPRLEIERRKQTRHTAEQSEAGKKGAAKRWGKHGEPMATLSPEAGDPIKSPVAENSSSSSTSVREEETVPPPRRLHQSTRPNRMNPAGVVPLLDTQFGEFVSRVSPEYPDRPKAYAAVLAWMNAEDDAATARGRAIGGDPFRWWQARFDAWKRDDAPARPAVCRHRHTPPCPNDAACTTRYMDEQRGVPATVAS
jgi:uncharacterized protein YdaU (DUF1376 family)